MENGDDLWLSPDKFQHILFCFTISILFSFLALNTRYSFLRHHYIFIGSLFSSSAGFAKELADHFGFFGSSGASAKDAAADLLGILLAALLLKFSKRCFFRNRPASVLDIV